MFHSQDRNPPKNEIKEKGYQSLYARIGKHDLTDVISYSRFLKIRIQWATIPTKNMSLS
jgi:hypothetical protein